MALSGFVLAGFVLLHMLGNVQIFLGPEIFNAYAHTLQTIPLAIKWGGRLFLMLCLVIHVWMAVILKIENQRARPENYAFDATVQATLASRTMLLSGSILLLFIVIHLLHFTVRVLFDYSDLHYDLGGVIVHDVYSMMIIGFKHWWLSLFYTIAMGLLCTHLSHGVSSMFQSLGIRNERWRYILDRVAIIYGWVVFLGFTSIPVSVLAGIIGPLT